MPLHWNIILEVFQKVFKRNFKNLQFLEILLCQGLCKRFQNIHNFQKNQNIFISFFGAKKHVLQSLMNVFESF